MRKANRGLGAAILLVTAWAANPAPAQENLEKGKTAAQLYASDCVVCHKSPRGLSKGGGGYGLENFLRAHYTASRESAAAISAYLREVDKAGKDEPAANKRKSRSAKPALPPAKPADGKSSDSKSSDSKASDSKASDSKASGETTSSDAAKPAGAKPPGKTN